LGSEWLVYDGGAIYTVLAEIIDVWDGNGWVLGYKLEVYQHNGLIYSYTMGDHPVNEYVLEVPTSSGTVYGGSPSNTYIIRDPGKVLVGGPVPDSADIYINNIKITNPALPYVVGTQAFTTMDIDAPSTYQYTVNLGVGWHLITFPIGYCYYQPGHQPADQPACVDLIDISALGYSTMAGWFSSTLIPNNPGTTAWNLVIGTDGLLFSSNPSIDTLYSMSPITGYWVEITPESGGATFSLNGPLFDPGCVISLTNDWRLVGYPLTVGYYDDENYIPSTNVPEGTVWIQVNPPVAEYVFRSIRNQYSMIVGPNGTYVPSLPNINTLHCIPPNSAYWIDMGSAAGLDYSFMGY
jgi:hypothetical protein